MKKIDNGIFRFYQFKNLEKEPRILHFISSMEGNIGLEESTNTGKQNRYRLGQSVGFNPKQMVLAHQTHSSNITIVKQHDTGKGAFNNHSRLPNTDALITNIPEICLTILTADCVPILLFDPVCAVIAAAHAGWRGTVENISGKTIEQMKKVFGSQPKDILVGIGPSIGPCCFEIGEEVAELFKIKIHDSVLQKKSGKWFANLWDANKYQLIQTGVLSEHIEIAEICTACPNSDFFSYRQSHGNPNRFGSGILLKQKQPVK